jgi:hypothetical protein
LAELLSDASNDTPESVCCALRRSLTSSSVITSMRSASLMAQTPPHLVTHNPCYSSRVSEGSSRASHLYLLAFDEAHLDNSFAKPPGRYFDDDVLSWPVCKSDNFIVSFLLEIQRTKYFCGFRCLKSSTKFAE